MTTVDEAVRGRTPLAADLAAGVDAVSMNQVVRFTRYVRLVLPLDGYVFWVRADLVSPGALLNAGVFNTVRLNQLEREVAPAGFIDAKGSLHYATETRQEEQNTYAANRVVFTSEVEVVELNEIAPNELYIAHHGGIRFAFSSRGSFYRQAELYHYVGSAVFSDMDTQVVDDPLLLNTKDVIVSNSLPLWLAFNGYVPTTPAYGFGNPTLTLYPSFLVPDNLVPPYAAVHIDPVSTRSLTGAPVLGRRLTHTQLVAETVRITLFGTRNFNALDFVDCVLQRSLDYEDFGIMNMPVIRDEKRTQSELNAIAQKKTVVFEINYYQQRVNDVARQLITEAIPSFVPGSLQAA